MDTRILDKSKLPSRHVTVGASRAPHCSSYYAMGLGQEDVDKTCAGVATARNGAQLVGTAEKGAATYPGAVAETPVYTDL